MLTKCAILKAFFHHLHHPPCYSNEVASAMCLRFYHLANMIVISGQNVFQIPVWFQNESHIEFFNHQKLFICARGGIFTATCYSLKNRKSTNELKVGERLITNFNNLQHGMLHKKF